MYSGAVYESMLSRSCNNVKGLSATHHSYQLYCYQCKHVSTDPLARRYQQPLDTTETVPGARSTGSWTTFLVPIPSYSTTQTVHTAYYHTQDRRHTSRMRRNTYKRAHVKQSTLAEAISGSFGLPAYPMSQNPQLSKAPGQVSCRHAGSLYSSSKFL